MLITPRRPFLGALAGLSAGAWLGLPRRPVLAVGTGGPAHGMSMYGDLAYSADFQHFAYANPDAPKGGTFTLSALQSFDSLNRFILKGVPAAGLSLIETNLGIPSQDESFAYYGGLFETIETPDDRDWVEFTLRAQATWHDGEPITAEDVVWTFNTLITEGSPIYRQYYADVRNVEQVDERTVRFTFAGGVNRELPLIMTQLTVLPKHYYADVPFTETSLEPPLGSGPYRIAEVDPGRAITYERVRDWWGENLPVYKGRFNFDTIRYEYYRDSNVALEAFKAGNYDFRVENTSRLWATQYEGERFDSEQIIKENIPGPNAGRMQGFVFNTRRAMFRDPKVRWALNHAFDFEWSNANLFYGLYQRIDSYFDGLESFEASAALPDERELVLLEPFRDQLPAEVFDTVYQPPVTDGSGNNRGNLGKAFQLLAEAGWSIQDGDLTEDATGQRMEFEILLVSPAFERIANPFARNLERLGCQVRIRTVDSSQYQNRLQDFDFDMIVTTWGQSDSPGNEQRDFWSTEAANTSGSRNYAGIENPVIDALIGKIIGAENREDLIAACRAMDRVLLWHHYVIPQWRDDFLHVAYWNKFSRPDVLPSETGVDLFAWWVDEQKLAELNAKRRG